MDIKTLNALLRNYYLHPRYGIGQLVRKPWSSIKQLKNMSELQEFMKGLTNIDSLELRKLMDEFRSKRNLHNHLEKGIKEIHEGNVERFRGMILYILCRKLNPDIVVETGVANGISSAYILCALEENKHSKLYSIDLPCEKGKGYPEGYFAPNGVNIIIPRGKESGWIIPDYLRDKWESILGRSSEKLPPLLDELGTIDMFLHDSEHSYQNMLGEYQTAWTYLKNGGILLSHDVDMNNAFSDFCRSVKAKSLILGNMGGVVKSK